MKPGMRMLAATTARRGESGNRDGYENSRMTYGYAGGMEDNYGPENRRHYRRYSDGRFAPRNTYNNGRTDEEMHYPTPYVPPVYERQGGEQRMNPIGFAPAGYWDTEQEYGMYADHKTINEMDSRSGQMQRGGASGKSMKLTREMADEWMENLQNEDGSKGPHWSMEQTKQVMNQRGIKGDPLEFYAILNALYSDYCKVFQKHNINKVDLYADLASAWINDKDAMDGKAALYYECIVQK